MMGDLMKKLKKEDETLTVSPEENPENLVVPKKDLSEPMTPEQLDELILKVKKAQEIYATYSQEAVDRIFKAAAKAANKKRIPLAKMAVEETGMGIVEDKIIKNHFASEYIYNKPNFYSNI